MFMEKLTLHFEKLAEHHHYFMKLDNSVQFGRPSSRKVITQVMIEFVSNTAIDETTWI